MCRSAVWKQVHVGLCMRGERTSEIVEGMLKCDVWKRAHRTCGHWEGTLLTRTLLMHFRLRLRSRNFRRQVCKRE